MAEIATIARPYARAAFAHAQATDARAIWSSLLAAAAMTVTDERVQPLLGNPRVGTASLADFLIGVSGAASLPDAQNFLRLLAQNGRLALLPEISSQFEALRSELENTADVTLTSATALTAEQQARFTQALTKRLKRAVRLHCEVNPALIGGAVVRAGDFVVDGTLKAKLERLSETLNS